MTTHDGSTQRLERLARHRVNAMSKDDPMLHCWDMVAQGIEDGMLDVAKLRRTLDSLKLGQGFGSQEIMFEPWEEQVQVSLLSAIAYCPAEGMLQELQGLLDAYYRFNQ